jgi:hypothetical protein
MSGPKCRPAQAQILVFGATLPEPTVFICVNIRMGCLPGVEAMTRFLIAAIALSLGASAAQAAHKHKRVQHHPPHAVAYIPVAPTDPYARFYNIGPRPPWAAPQQCFTDEGYGRYWPCGAGPSVTGH